MSDLAVRHYCVGFVSLAACGCEVERLELLPSDPPPVVVTVPGKPDPQPQPQGDAAAPPIATPPASATPLPTVSEEPTAPAPPDAGDQQPAVEELLAIPFATPTEIPGLGAMDTEEDDPTLTEDRLQMFFNSRRSEGPGEGDIWVTTRSSVADPWDEPTKVSVSTNANETTPSISADGLELWFSRKGGCQGDSHSVMRATRSDSQGAWSEPKCVNRVNSGQNDFSPEVDASGRILVITSERQGSFGAADLYWSVRDSASGPWSIPVQIPNINSADNDSEGQLVLGGKVLVFVSTRAGERDLFYAVRSDLTGAFSQPIAMASVNSQQVDSDPWASEDFKYIVFSSDRDGKKRLYEAGR